MKNFFLIIFLPILSLNVGVHGFALFSNGIGRVAIGYLDALCDHNVSLIETRELSNLIDLVKSSSKCNTL